MSEEKKNAIEKVLDAVLDGVVLKLAAKTKKTGEVLRADHGDGTVGVVEQVNGENVFRVSPDGDCKVVDGKVWQPVEGKKDAFAMASKHVAVSQIFEVDFSGCTVRTALQGLGMPLAKIKMQTTARGNGFAWMTKNKIFRALASGLLERSSGNGKLLSIEKYLQLSKEERAVYCDTRPEMREKITEYKKKLLAL